MVLSRRNGDGGETGINSILRRGRRLAPNAETNQSVEGVRWRMDEASPVEIWFGRVRE